jgi:hypothetical protein
MHHQATPSLRFLAALALSLGMTAGVVGCSSSPVDVELTMPDFEGTYSLIGTYTGRPGNSVEGSLVISDQVEGVATAAISVKLTDNGNVFFALNAEDPGVAASALPGQATLEEDGSISISYTGSEVISGIDPASCCTFTFSLQGTLSGDRISGTWTLSRDMPSYDTGTFGATR